MADNFRIYAVQRVLGTIDQMYFCNPDNACLLEILCTRHLKILASESGFVLSCSVHLSHQEIPRRSLAWGNLFLITMMEL